MFLLLVIMRSTEVSHNIGFGIDLKHFSYQYQTLLFVTLDNLTANNNSLPCCVSGFQTVIYAVFVNNLVLNNVNISNNGMTGLVVRSTTVVVNGTVVFHNNTGINGGGLAMYENSYLVFHENTILYFTNNSAREKGGAIFVKAQPQNDISLCFFQYSDHTHLQSVQVVMAGNKADLAGTVLYGEKIHECLLFNSKLTLDNESFDKTFNYSAQTGPSVISSEPTDVCFCDDNNTINCSQTQLTMTA